MNFRRYNFEVPFGALAENLVNSHDVTLATPEHLRTTGDLGGFLEQHGLPIPRRLTSADLEGTKRLRAQVRELFEAQTQTSAMQCLNALLEDARVTLRIVRQKGMPRLKWAADSSVDLLTSLRSAIAVNAAHIVTEFGFERLKVCHAAPCIDVFVDVSKRGEQRYCGPRCATRRRVAAYRSRQA
jgi:predicted RNA-binding Zn ribbon-like protein